MTCEICDTQTATMWVEKPTTPWTPSVPLLPKKVLSCDDCGPQAGYTLLAPLEPASTR